MLRSSGITGALVALTSATAVLLLAVGPAGAHTELDVALPGVGDEVGGTIDEIQLEFRGLIEDAEIRVFEPDGDEITGSQHTEVDGSTAVQQIETITVTGQHQVTYTVVSVDGDLQNGAYVFTYDPDAPALPNEDEGGSTVLLWGFVIISVVILALGYSRLRRGDDTSPELSGE